MKKIITLLSIILLVFSCSSDDTSNDSNDSNDTVICNIPTNISINSIIVNSATINWNGNNASSYEIEYGISGFTPGQGMTISTSNLEYELTDLTQATSYDIYLTAKCSDTNYSDVAGPFTFITEVACLKPTSLNLDNVDICSISLNWDSNGESDFKIEYGIAGFTLGTGRVIVTTDSYTTIDYYLQPGITYDIYVRANCGSDGYSAYSDPLVVTTVSQDLAGSYHVTVTRDDGFSYDHGIETITLVSPNYYKTETTGLWPLGSFLPDTDQGFNFENSCGEIEIPDQQLFQGAYLNMVYGYYGEVLSNGDLIIFYNIDLSSGYHEFYADYVKQ